MSPLKTMGSPNGKVKSSPEMDRRLLTYRRSHEGYGEILVQMNVEDTRFGSRLGFVDHAGFLKEVARLRKVGFKRITLKTGAHGLQELAMALRWGAEARIDLLTIDGAPGGTGMSTWGMMNERGTPTLYLQADRDVLIRPHNIARIRALRPDVRIAQFDTLHFLLQLEPRRSAAAIAAFLEGLPG